MDVRQNITGQVFDKLTAESVHSKGNGSTVWNCKCECGNIVQVTLLRLQRYPQPFCSDECPFKPVKTKPQRESQTHLYKVWGEIKRRCYIKTCNVFHHYGGKCIGMGSWRKDFSAFKEWALASGYEEGLSIDRLDNSKDYSPANCKWVPRSHQARNTSRTVKVERNGESFTNMKEMIEKYYPGMLKVVEMRRRKGWLLTDCLHFPKNYISMPLGKVKDALLRVNSKNG